MSTTAESTTSTEAYLATWPRMLTLIPETITVDSTVSAGKSETVISMKTTLARRQSLRSKKGEDLSKLEWRVSLHKSVSHEVVADGKGVGIACFVEAYESEHDSLPAVFSLWASLGEEQFDRLLRTLLSGKSISYLRAHIIGIEYDGLPDGSGKVWDTTDGKNVVLSELEWGACVAASGEYVEEVDVDIPSPSKPATAQDFNNLAATLKSAVDEHTKILGWILAAVALGVCLQLFR